MFPNSLALTNCPKTLQQTFDVKCRPPQAITIETLHPPQKRPPIQNMNQNTYQPLGTSFENKMLAMKLLARNRITSSSRQDTNSNVSTNNPCVNDTRKVHKVESLQKKAENPKSNPEIVRLKNILEDQLSQLESIVDPSKAKKSQGQEKKLALSQQAEEKELSLKINRVISSLSREVSSLERRVNRLPNVKEDTNELGKKLLSTYQFSMSFVQTYHTEYSSKLTESSQKNFREKLSRLTKSLADCVTQLSEFPNFDFPMPDLGSKPKQTPAAVKQKIKVSNQKKNPNLPKRSSRNVHLKLAQNTEHKPLSQDKHYIRKPTNPIEVHHNLSSDESLISLLAKPGHSRLTSPSNSRIQLGTHPLSTRSTNIAIKPSMVYLDIGPVIDGLSQETIEELIDEQISDVICSIDISEVATDLTPLQTLQSLPKLIEDLDYYLTAIDSYEDMVSSVERNLKNMESPTEYKPKGDIVSNIDLHKDREETMIIIPRPTPNIDHLETDTTPQDELIISSINPVFIQNLTDDKFKMLRHNRLHQPSIRFAMKHNLLDSLKNDILNKSMDTVSEQIFQTLDNYVENNFFDEFLKTPETMNLLQNIMRSADAVTPEKETCTLGIQTDKLTKNVQIQSALSSPSLTNTPTLSQIYTSDFSTDKSNIETTPISEQSSSLLQEYKSSLLDSPTEKDFTSVPSFVEESVQTTNNEDSEQDTELVRLQDISEESLSSESPFKQSLLALTPIMDASSLLPVETDAEESISISGLTPLPEEPPADPNTDQLDSTISPVLSDNGSTAIQQLTSKSSEQSSLVSNESSLNDLAFGSVLRKRSDIVCLDIDSILPIDDITDVHDPTTHTLTANSETDVNKQKLTHSLQEYSTTFSQSYSTLYSPSETQFVRTSDAINHPQTPLYQDSLDNTNANTHSLPDTDTNTDTPSLSIEEEITISLSN